MSKIVPFQNSPSQEIALGGEVQFSGGSVTPMQDVVTDDIQRFSQAQTQLGKTLGKLDDELNDAESKKLYNNLHADIEAATANYTNLTGAAAVLPTGETEEGKKTTAFDDTNKQYEAILKEYTDQSSNGIVKFMLENMAQVSIKSAQSKITQHSLKQQRILKENETNAKIENHQNSAIMSITKFNEPGSEHWVSFMSGVREIQHYALDQNWNIDPSKGEVSSQYLKKLQEYTTTIHDKATSYFKENNLEALGKKYFQKHAEGFNVGGQMVMTADGNTVIRNLTELEKSETEHCAVKICDNVLNFQGNSNDNSFLSQANFLLTLDSNNTSDNGNGSSIIDGNNADLMENVESTQSENIENLQKVRSTSKYYNPTSPLAGQIIPQHATAHLFAIQKLGVEEADSLYSNAIKDANIDRQKYNSDPVYFVEINKKVMQNFNKSFLAKVENAYTPQVQELTKKVTTLKEKNSKMKSKGVYREKKKKLKAQINSLEGELEIVKDQAYTYVNSITNDLDVINQDVDYEYAEGKVYVEVDGVTNLPPLSYYENKIKSTIKDPEKLETALSEARFKYNKIKKERTENYNAAYTNAEDIAFSEPDGWKLLKQNGIDINQFTVADQKKLKSGQPSESDEKALMEIENNEKEVLTDENKLKAFRYQLSPEHYEYYVNQLNGNKSNKSKGAGLKVDPDIFKEGLFENNIKLPAKKEHQLKMAYRDRLNFYYDNGIEITYEKRKAILKEILTDKVMFDKGFFGGTLGFDITGKKNVYHYEEGSKDFDRLYVEVGDQDIYLREIPMNVRSEISRNLLINGEPITTQNIANSWVEAGMPKDTDTYKKGLRIIMMRGE